MPPKFGEKFEGTKCLNTRCLLGIQHEANLRFEERQPILVVKPKYYLNLFNNYFTAANVTVAGLIPTWGNKIFNINHFFALVTKQWVALSSAIQHAMPPKFGCK